jgi:polysaccharide biosynthesis transport protein
MPIDQRMSTFQDSSQHEHGLENSGPGPIDWALGFLRRQYLLIVFTTVLALGASVVAPRIMPPTYTAQLKLLLGGSKPPRFSNHRYWTTRRSIWTRSSRY